MTPNDIIIPEEFEDIRPLTDGELKAHMETLVADPGFMHFVQFIMPYVRFDEFRQTLLQISTVKEFQDKIACPFLISLAQQTSDGLSSDGLKELSNGQAHTFITNHRDIVLDASFLNLILSLHHVPTCEIAIGNNLLVYKWIETLVKINKSFIVKRDTTLKGRLLAAIQLSNYIHFAINEKRENVWIAQRQGRAKDSNDLTQESLVKMLSMGGKTVDPIANLRELNIAPIAICYEVDPNDYLKALEMLNKKKDPYFKKSQSDDILSMGTGLRGYKGRIHYQFAPCINDELEKIPLELNKQERLMAVCAIIDKAIHSNYYIYPCNYVAYDMLGGTSKFADNYTQADVDKFERHLSRRVAKTRVTDDDDKAFIKARIIEMYANPLVNKLKATNAQ